MRYLLFIFFFSAVSVQAQLCRFEKTGGKETATYFEVINWYRQLDKMSDKVKMKEMGPTDAGYPLHLVLVSNDGSFSPDIWYRKRKLVILVNNGIHPGEPDGIDASMMFVRDIVKGKIRLPDNIALAFIPVYNIGGCLNRGTSSRANQDGPLEYGFRGNAQNLDLNRDFTKCDSREARSFTSIFQWLGPDIFIDNHVSDGADYQYTFTLLTTQYDKLGAAGQWFRNSFEPMLFAGMAEKQQEIAPYVNFETETPDKGMQMFFDPPRFSSGYAALFQTFAMVPETHMLKPFKSRVEATYAFLQTVMEKGALMGEELIREREKARDSMMQQQEFVLNWTIDSTRFRTIHFKGYDAGYKKSEVTGMDRLFYDHNKPFDKEVNYYDCYKPLHTVKKPKAYIVPQGWVNVIELLQLNAVQMQRFDKDTMLEVEVYHIDDYKSYSRPYEKHHRNYSLKLSSSVQKIRLLKGDYIVYLNQPAVRYIVEMLEPAADDSFFSWNFFDAILQQKEGYSDYRWEDVAAEIVKKDPGLRLQLEEKKKGDVAFAADASAQLDFVYKHSSYYEPAHMRYPVYRLLQ